MTLPTEEEAGSEPVTLDARLLVELENLSPTTVPEATGAVEFSEFDGAGAADDEAEDETVEDDEDEDEDQLSCARENPARAKTVNDGSDSFIWCSVKKHEFGL